MSDADLEPRALAAALAGDADSRRAALERLAALPPADAARLVDEPLAAALATTLGSERRSEQRGAAEALARLLPLSEPLRAALHRVLTAPATRLRWGAAYTLGRGLPPTRDLWPAARETMALDDGDQRWAAAELACAIARADSEVLDELRATLDADAPTLRKMSLYCLRDLGTPDAPALAHRLLRDPDAGVRLAALAGVTRSVPGSELAREAATTLLVLLASDPDAGVRRAAAAALGKLGVAAEPVLRALDEASRSPDASLARAAAASRRLLGGAA